MWESLSARESEVLELAADGLIDTAIAARLEISVATVRGYWMRIRSKMGVASRAELVARHVKMTALASLGDLFDDDDSAWTSARLEADRALAEERAAMDLLLHDMTPAQRASVAALRQKMDKLRAERQAFEDEGRRERRLAKRDGRPT